jgi:hypothetical protein
MLYRTFSSATFDASKQTSCSLQPNDCPCVDNRDGQTELHRFCQDSGTSAHVIQDFLSRYPKSASMQDVYGRTALFYAIKRSLPFDIVQLLFRACPEAIVQPDFCKECPLDLLFRPNQPASYLDFVFQERPALALHRPPTFSGTTLLQRICDPRQDRGLYSCESASDQAWVKLLLTVRAAHCTRHPSHSYPRVDRTLPELRVAIELDLPHNLIARFCQLYPHQASQPMSRHGDGTLPLHYVICTLGQSKRNHARGGFLIRALLAAHPEAACVRQNGCYPLHLALSRGFKWSEGVRELAFACHDALHSPTKEGLYPSQLAAIAAEESGLDDLETIYCLIREHPIVHTGPHKR